MVRGPRRQYSSEQLDLAVKACREGLTVSSVSHKYGVPRATLLDKLTGKSALHCQIGRKPCLNDEEETELVCWINEQGRRGVPPKKTDVLISAAEIVARNPKRETLFIRGMPGLKWFLGFRKRQKYPTVRLVKTLSRSISKITKGEVVEWFMRLRQDMEGIGEGTIFNEPSRIFNSDELNLELCPRSGKVLGVKEWRNVYFKSSQTKKSTMTFLGTTSADGQFVVPYIVYPHVRITKDIIRATAKHSWSVGVSESGWTTCETFYQFLEDGFIPHINENKIKKPVLLLVHGNKAHISIKSSLLCQDNGVLLYQVPPNTMHIELPSYISIFRPLKLEWSAFVDNWKSKNPNQCVTKLNVVDIFADVISKKSSKSIKKAFKVTGFCPFNPYSFESKEIKAKEPEIKVAPKDFTTLFKPRSVPKLELDLDFEFECVDIK